MLTGSTPFRSPSPRYAGATEALNDYWFKELQPRLARLSTRGHLVLDEHAEHPDAVVKAIHSLLTEVRAEQ